MFGGILRWYNSRVCVKETITVNFHIYRLTLGDPRTDPRDTSSGISSFLIAGATGIFVCEKVNKVR